MPTLQYVQPTDEQKEIMKNFRDKMQQLYDELSSGLAEGRGKSLALAKLEECAIWVNKSITNNA